jgi:tetratricopeptide (TPR) repeat protein
VAHLLAFAMRPVAEVARVLDAARTAHGWDELRPRPLGHADALSLLPAALDGRVREGIVGEAGGNPLFLQELARLAARDGDALPHTLVAVVRREVEGLPPGSRAMLAGASVAGDPFDPEVAAAAADLDAGDSLTLLDTLAAADLVRPAGTGRAFAFRHPIVRRVVYEEAPPGWRLAAHERAAALLAARGAPPAVRAYHVERCGRPGDEAAIALLEEAARTTASTSPAAAAHWYAAALRLLPHGDTRRRADLLAAGGQALAAAGRPDEARTALEEAASLLPPTARPALVARAAQLDLVMGNHSRARSLLLGALDDAPTGVRGIMLVQLAGVAYFAREPEEIVAWAERAAAEPPTVALLATAEAMLALGRLWLGEPAGELLDRIDQRLRSLDDAELVDDISITWTVGSTILEGERFAAAARPSGAGSRSPGPRTRGRSSCTSTGCSRSPSSPDWSSRPRASTPRRPRTRRVS